MQVWLCKEIKTGKIVALKKLKKAEMVKRGQIDHVKAERDVLAGIHNPFIVRLYYSFQVGHSLWSMPHCWRVPATWLSKLEVMALHCCCGPPIGMFAALYLNNRHFAIFAIICLRCICQYCVSGMSAVAS